MAHRLLNTTLPKVQFKKLVRRFKRLPVYRLWKCIAKFAYYTLLHVSSCTVKDMRMWTHHKTLLHNDVKVYSDRCYVSPRWSKTMQAQAQTTNIVIAAAGDRTCLVTAVRKYINSHPLRRNEPFFQTVAGTPVTQHLW